MSPADAKRFSKAGRTAQAYPDGELGQTASSKDWGRRSTDRHFPFWCLASEDVDNADASGGSAGRQRGSCRCAILVSKSSDPGSSAGEPARLWWCFRCLSPVSVVTTPACQRGESANMSCQAGSKVASGACRYHRRRGPAVSGVRTSFSTTERRSLSMGVWRSQERCGNVSWLPAMQSAGDCLADRFRRAEEGSGTLASARPTGVDGSASCPSPSQTREDRRQQTTNIDLKVRR